MYYTDNLVDCSYHDPQVTVDNTTSSTTESLQIHGSPQLGYYVQLGLGTPYHDQVVSIFVMSVNINTSQSNCSTASWWTLVAVTLSLLG